jgi:prephenate dehydrogenase
MIGVVGIGLIGSSIALAVKRAHPAQPILVCDASAAHLGLAEELGLGDDYTADTTAVAARCRIIFVCIPARQIAKIIVEMVPHLAENSIITDVGSTKRAVVQAVESQFPDFDRFVPGHPMAGGEKTGPRSGRADLFERRPYFLTPSARCDAGAVSEIVSLVRSFGANVAMASPDVHDMGVACTSHVPHLYAFAAMLSAGSISASLSRSVFDFSGPSFEEIARIGSADPTMWTDILLTNSDAIVQSYQKMRSHMDEIVECMQAQDGERLADLLRLACTAKSTVRS